jgi:hypothetical protein
MDNSSKDISIKHENSASLASSDEINKLRKSLSNSIQEEEEFGSVENGETHA